jgi:hypothetical protein
MTTMTPQAKFGRYLILTGDIAGLIARMEIADDAAQQAIVARARPLIEERVRLMEELGIAGRVDVN